MGNKKPRRSEVLFLVLVKQFSKVHFAFCVGQKGKTRRCGVRDADSTLKYSQSRTTVTTQYYRTAPMQNYIIPPMPPIPPISGIAGASSFGNSATMQSVVSIKPATDAAFCNAERVTLVGSRTPISTISP